MEQYFTEKNIRKLMAVLLLSALFLRLISAVSFVNTFDVYWYRSWAVDLPQGLFSVYARAEAITLDYPPIYLFFLYPLGLIYEVIGTSAHEYTQMLIMKFWPVVFDTLCCLMFYLLIKKWSKPAAFFAAALWAVNPSAVFNSSFWGQTDGLMIFMLLASFLALDKGFAVRACVLFALAGMTKFQCLYFTPIFLLDLFYKVPIKRFALGIAAAAATVIVVFTPFMIGSENPFLFFSVYLGSAGKYPYCTLNAFNLYGALGLNWVNESTPVFGFFTYGMLSSLFVFLSLIGVIALYVLGKKRCPFVASFLFMQCIFMLTTRMHERYQIVVLPFVLIAYFIHKKPAFFAFFGALSLLTLANQALLLLKAINEWVPWSDSYGSIMSILSVVNLLIFIYSCFISVKFLICKDKKEEQNVAEV